LGGHGREDVRDPPSEVPDGLTEPSPSVDFSVTAGDAIDSLAWSRRAAHRRYEWRRSSAGPAEEIARRTR
jgi:hypothetical protein